MFNNRKPIFKIKKLYDDVEVPFYVHKGDAGMDIRSYEDIIIERGKTVLISTGFCLELPEGFEAQIRPRSGFALKNPAIIPNSPATIDSGYKGEIKVIMRNISMEKGDHIIIKKGDRIAQLVFASVLNIGEFKVIEKMQSSERGSNGFGSSGIN